jgi:probable HAF family extracellular repeat protein
MNNALQYVLVLASLSTPLFAQSYSIEDIGTLSTDPAHAVRASGINNRGHVHGENNLPAPPGAGKINGFFWDGHTQVKIQPVSPALAFGGAINDSDQCVGYMTAGGGKLHQYIWENGVTNDIHLGPLNFSRAYDINSAGYIAGTTSEFIPGYFISQFRPFLRDPSGSWIDLGTFGGGGGFTRALNDHQHVVGTAKDALEDSHPFLWIAGAGMINLGSLAGATAPYGIDNYDRIVGLSADSNDNYQPFFWQAGTMTDLGTLDGGAGLEGLANSINDHGFIVGYSDDAAGVQHATIWSPLPGGGYSAPVNLDTLIPSGSGWTLTGAAGINELGEITGTGWLNGNKRAFRLTPVLSQARLSGLHPGISGQASSLFGMGFTPGAPIFIAYGFSSGQIPVPGCPVSLMDIAAPQIFTVLAADADGRLELPIFLPPALMGLTVLVQGVDPINCGVSELLTQTFQ